MQKTLQPTEKVKIFPNKKEEKQIITNLQDSIDVEYEDNEQK